MGHWKKRVRGSANQIGKPFKSVSRGFDLGIGKDGGGQVPERIRQLHHKALDDLIDQARKSMHEMLDNSYKTGALTPEMKDDNYVLPKAIVTIWGRKEAYAPFGSEETVRRYKRNINNLEKFI